MDIPIGAKRRITFASDYPLTFVEVQTESSFDENEMTRHEDNFDRV